MFAFRCSSTDTGNGVTVSCYLIGRWRLTPHSATQSLWGHGAWPNVFPVTQSDHVVPTMAVTGFAKRWVSCACFHMASCLFSYLRPGPNSLSSIKWKALFSSGCWLGAGEDGTDMGKSFFKARLGFVVLRVNMATGCWLPYPFGCWLRVWMAV